MRAAAQALKELEEGDLLARKLRTGCAPAEARKTSLPSGTCCRGRSRRRDSARHLVDLARKQTYQYRRYQSTDKRDQNDCRHDDRFSLEGEMHLIYRRRAAVKKTTYQPTLSAY
jgi:hypothetical protein